jgi:hypothetical protein
MRVGDANTKFFHVKASARRRKNFIATLAGEGGIVTEHQHKAALIKGFFDNLLGAAPSPPAAVDWPALEIPQLDLSELDVPFTADEVRQAIADLPADRAPGPDGFSGGFFKAAAHIILPDLLLAFGQLHAMNRNGLARVNAAHIVLIPKSDGAATVRDYRPISLIHGVIKIFTNILATRLSRRIAELISPGQSVFIRRRCIQDNFLYVHNLVRHFHRRKTPAILLKLDVEKAFDTVSWPYLLDALRARGFSSRWCNWISIILSSSSSRVLLNGIEGEPIVHHRGLRQGDPLSPLLFILAMEPLQRILALATERGLLSPLKGRVARLRSSLYADDATIFLNPLAIDVQLVKAILERFRLVFGLRINFRKSAAYPLRCGGIDVTSVLAPLGMPTAALPFKYLGLPLSTRQLRRVDWQALIDKIASCLATWKGKLMLAAGLLALLNAVLSSISVY